MREKQRHIAFLWEVVASIVGAVLISGTTLIVSQSWFLVACAVLVWFACVAVMAAVVRRNYNAVQEEYERRTRHQVNFRRPLVEHEAQERIRSAELEIWSFQISGSEFTTHSVGVYRKWLEDDGNHCLRIAFANPNNIGLLESIVKLSGQAKLVDHDEKHSAGHLRRQVQTALKKYVKLRAEFGDRIDVRVYDFSPPYSIHAVDPEADYGSLFVELYMPDLRPSERPSMLLTPDHPEYSLYQDKSMAWFRASSRAQPSPQAPAPDRVGS